MSEEMIIPDLVSQDREGALKEMGHFLRQRNRIDGHDELFEKLIQREKMGSTAIGEGVAVPHCKMMEVSQPIVLLAISRKGVDFESLDGKLTHIFFLIVSPPENLSLNLQILAAIAHLVRRVNSLQKKILGAKSPGRIIKIVQEEEEKLNE